MRNDNWMKGEFFFPALVGLGDGKEKGMEYTLTNEVYGSFEDARACHPSSHHVIWPVESLEDVVFAPDPEELVEVKR